MREVLYEAMVKYESVVIVELTIVKRTPCGYWLCYGKPGVLTSFEFWRQSSGRSLWKYCTTKQAAIKGLLKRLRYRHRLYLSKAELMTRFIDVVERTKHAC